MKPHQGKHRVSADTPAEIRAMVRALVKRRKTLRWRHRWHPSVGAWGWA